MRKFTPLAPVFTPHEAW